MARLRTLAASLTLLVAGLVALRATPPLGYYTPAEGQSGASLRVALHAIVRNHTVIPYSSSTHVDTSDALKVLDEDPANTNHVWLPYAQRSEPKATFGLATGWNREHLWCNSYGLDDVMPAYSDLHNLRAEDANVNSARGNKFYEVSDPTAPGYKQPAHAESPLCSTDGDSWEPPDRVKGDIARALFYMTIRYTGDVAGEPALTLTDETGLIASSTNLMGRFTTLLRWHFADPVDAAEQHRNDRVEGLYQGNRNPFVDRPEWVAAAFVPALGITCAGTNLVLSWTHDHAPALGIEAASEVAAGWTLVTNGPVLVEGNWKVTVPVSMGTRFYRWRVE